ncbi:MAG: hypothetical protein ACXVUE_16385 [Solirubrobacteraceae bacterium]
MLGRLVAIVGSVLAIAGGAFAVAGGAFAVVRGLVAVHLRALTVPAWPARHLIDAAGAVADVGEAVTPIRRDVPLRRRGVALDGRRVALDCRAVTRLGNTRPRVARLITCAARVTARLSGALISSLGCGPITVAGRMVAISRGLVAV